MVTWRVETVTNLDEVIAALEDPASVDFSIPKLAVEDSSPEGGFNQYPPAVRKAQELLPEGLWVRLRRVE